MPRLNLKELKDLLNKVDDKLLQRFAISHDLGVEDGCGEFALIFGNFGDDEEAKLLGFYSTEEYEKLKAGLINYLNRDVIEIAKAKIDPDYPDEVIEDWEPDWE